MDPRRAKLADLYYVSKSARFDGPFEFSVHRDNPNLEKSPSYLHYPEPEEPGSEHLAELYAIAARLMTEQIKDSGIWFDAVAAVPVGAIPLAEALIAELKTPIGIARVSKDESTPEVFKLAQVKPIEGGVRLLIVDDHTSGGRNKRLIRAAAKRAGYNVTDMITVVDRQQGGVEAMAAAGVRMHALLTLEDILRHGVSAGYIDEPTAELTRGYVRRNQLGSQ